MSVCWRVVWRERSEPERFHISFNDAVFLPWVFLIITHRKCASWFPFHRRGADKQGMSGSHQRVLMFALRMISLGWAAAFVSSARFVFPVPCGEWPGEKQRQKPVGPNYCHRLSWFDMLANTVQLSSEPSRKQAANMDIFCVCVFVKSRRMIVVFTWSSAGAEYIF